MSVDGSVATTPRRVTLMLWALTFGAFLTTSSGATRSPFLLDMAHDLDTDLMAVANLMAVKETVDDVLKLTGRDQFAEFTLMDGSKVWMRASAIGWVSQEFPAAGIPKAGSFVGLGLAPGRATALKEDVDTVHKAIEQITPN